MTISQTITEKPGLRGPLLVMSDRINVYPIEKEDMYIINEDAFGWFATSPDSVGATFWCTLKEFAKIEREISRELGQTVRGFRREIPRDHMAPLRLLLLPYVFASKQDISWRSRDDSAKTENFECNPQYNIHGILTTLLMRNNDKPKWAFPAEPMLELRPVETSAYTWDKCKTWEVYVRGREPFA
ncbi:hypothetical protein PCH_Pc16g12240 [Penicillium rubens Wisconsin 54-1255]|uniref:Uncharacterized protein n=1 Tax=Penicillium rubens (strain ATCC 28089 / DSM 1075 / NRRL 1951 / Wisconsin 54-1255) TaxID=500485 RepID=B6HAB5_PENRW|nr:hypothetical protein PCH_Pc16g12240 [Penicillium rubens Wisconsin 54-1255]